MTLLSLLVLGLLSTESNNYSSFLFILLNLNYGNMISLALRGRKRLLQILFATTTFYIFYLATNPSACILCLLAFQNWCISFTENGSQWVQTLLIILSNDVHQNPGPPFHNSLFTFMSWNVNSLAKDNFHRVRLIEAHNSILTMT